MKIAVVGTGYVGLSNAILLAQNHEVYAVDVIPEKVEMINRGISPIVDKEITEYLATKELNLTATLDGTSVYKDADYIIISTPTNYDEEIKYCRIPSMVLQPIIENCVLHGLSKKMDNESFHAKIDVTAEKESEFLKIYVIDNGVGMDDRTIKEVFEKDSSQKRGIGIFNVDERIKLLYGEDYGITIKSKPGIYTEVEMKFKFIQNG